MTLDEAIFEFKERAEDSRKISELGIKSYIPKEKEEEQLTEWLEELKKYREIGTVEECKNSVLKILEAYNKAIDDFVKEICKMIVQSENNDNYRFYAVEIKQAMADIAEQLKDGGGE